MSESDHRQRLAAILAADVVGYSRLMAQDERGTVAALDSAREVFRAEIEAAPGRVIDMAGDSVLAVFDSATGALSTALAVQRRLQESTSAVPDDRRMRFRIGVHLGDVIEKGDGSVYGDGVNVAARLQALAEPGGITVSVAVHGAVGQRLSATFIDQGEREIKNMAPLRVFGVRPAESGGPEAPTRTLARRDRPSIAVLPFANMSGDPEQEYVADGISEDVITELSRFRSISVMARNSSFMYRGQATDVRKVAKELGVRYVLEGSVRRSGPKIRITAQLIDATNGHHVWAERYDRDLVDLFAVQDEVARKIIGAIAPGIVMAEIEHSRSKISPELDTWDRIMQAHWRIRRFTREDFAEACRLLEELLTHEPDNAVALGDLAFSLHFAAIFGWMEAETAMTRMGEVARRAVNADGQDSTAHTALAIHELFSGRHDDALRRLRRAVELNPNASFAHGYVGIVHAFGGEPELALEGVREALRLSPRDLLTVIWRVGEGWAHLAAERFAEAAECAQMAIDWNPAFVDAHAILAAARAHAGQMEDARVALREVMRRMPALTTRDHRLVRPFRRPADQTRFVEGLRKAGLPAHDGA